MLYYINLIIMYDIELCFVWDEVTYMGWYDNY